MSKQAKTRSVYRSMTNADLRKLTKAATTTAKGKPDYEAEAMVRGAKREIARRDKRQAHNAPRRAARITN